MPRSSRRSSASLDPTVVPPFTPTLPNQPSWYSFLSATSSTFSRSPSWMPEARVASDSRSMTRILSTTAAGRLFRAVLWSLKKNVRPPTVSLSISSPLNFTLPSSVISMPGIRFRRSRSMALAPTRKEEALNSTVSCFTTMGLPTSVTVAACRKCSSTCSRIVPMSTSASRKYRSFTKGL